MFRPSRFTLGALPPVPAPPLEDAETAEAPEALDADATLAWSLADDDEQPQRQSWSSTWGIRVSSSRRAVRVVAGVTGVVVWVSTLPSHVPDMPVPTTPDADPDLPRD